MFLILLFGSLFILPSFAGGATILSIFLIFYKFPMYKAGSLTNLIIMTNAFIMFLFGSRKYDPYKKT